jgi:hypothetical protein
MADYANVDRNISGQPIDLSQAVSFWMYHPKTDEIDFSTDVKKMLGLTEDEVCYLSRIKSMILGVDIPCFLQYLHKWMEGDTSEIVQVRIIDCKKQMRTIQIKAHIRFGNEGAEELLYGAYFDVDVLKN